MFMALSRLRVKNNSEKGNCTNFINKVALSCGNRRVVGYPMTTITTDKNNEQI